MARAYRVPDVAVEVGLGKRFRYWAGRSGQSYLFTRISLAELSEFPESVAIVTRSSDVIAAGLGRDLAGDYPESIRGRFAYVHLLTSTKADSLRIIDDVDPDALQPRLDLVAA